MRGHEQIIAMRRLGHLPSFIFLNDYPCKTDWLDNLDHATVSTAGDALERLDLRFLVGCRVSIASTSEKRAMALFEHVKAAGASTVAACHVQHKKHDLDQTGWMKVYHQEAENG